MEFIIVFIAQQVIQQALDLPTEMGIKCQEMLLRGEAIPDDVIAKMIEDKINSQEVAHHGKYIFYSLGHTHTHTRTHACMQSCTRTQRHTHMFRITLSTNILDSLLWIAS